MAGISVKLNLAALKCVVKPQKTQSGEMIDVLIIPIVANNLFRGDKGGVYLDLTAFETDPTKRIAGSKDTHIVKQALPKDLYDKMTEEERRATPIIGNAILWESTRTEIPAQEIGESDDLPF